MLPYFWYILKVIICSGILFGYYWLFLRNKIFHQYNRFYLLSAMILSLLLPLLKIDFWLQTDTPQASVIKVLQAVSAGDEYMSNVIITANKTGWSFQQLFPLLYWMISIVFFLVLVKTLFAIRSLLKRYPVQEIEKVSFVNTNDKSTPFSFFKYIFWNVGIDMDTYTGKQIFKHEVAHIQEKHTHDKLSVNILLIFFWCNPFFWLYRKELNMIHEFIADKKAVEDSDTASFAAMILQAAYPGHRFELTNNFFYSPIKRRLLMLTKNNNPKVNYIGRIMVLPLAVLIFAAFTLKSKSNHHIYYGKKITVVIDAGHGGRDAGAKSADGILEKDLTLAIARQIRSVNNNDAIEILLVRDEDIYITPGQKSTFAKSRNVDLVISLHVGAEAVPNLKSGLSFYIPAKEVANSESSRILASALINEFSNNFSLPVLQFPQQSKKPVWILKSMDCPTVLFETGFMTSEKDMTYLKTSEAKDVIARNILSAIEKFAMKRQQEMIVNSNIIAGDTIPSQGMIVNVKHADSTYMKSEEYKTKALIIVDSKEIGNLGCNYLDKNNDNYSSVVVYAPTEAQKLYGEKGRYGVIKLTKKDITFISAKTVTYDEKNKTINLTGPDITLKSGLSSTVIYIDDKLSSEEELNTISPDKISSINIIKGEKLDDFAEAKDKTAIIQVNLKPDDLQEVVVMGFKTTQPPVAIALDKMNVFYIGVDNPITLAVPNIPSDKLLVTINNGLIKGSNGKYIVRVTTLGETTITVATIKDDRKVLLSTQTFRVKRIPDPVNGQVPIDFEIKFKQDNELEQLKEKQIALQLDQNKAKLNLAQQTLVYKDLQEKELLAVKQNIQLAQQYKTKLDLGEKTIDGVKLKNMQDLALKEHIVLGYQSQSKLENELAQKTLEEVKLASLANLGVQQKLLLEKQNKTNLQLEEKTLLNKITDSLLMKTLSDQKKLLLSQPDINNLVFVKTEVSPMFTGGDDAWRKYLEKNLDPRIPMNDGWKAGKYTVIVKFIVRMDGTVSDVGTENYKGSKTSKHCISIIQQSPKWQPAIQNGKKVNAYKRQPITFVIEE